MFGYFKLEEMGRKTATSCGGFYQGLVLGFLIVVAIGIFYRKEGFVENEYFDQIGTRK